MRMRRPDEGSSRSGVGERRFNRHRNRAVRSLHRYIFRSLLSAAFSWLAIGVCTAEPATFTMRTKSVECTGKDEIVLSLPGPCCGAGKLPAGSFIIKAIDLFQWTDDPAADATVGITGGRFSDIISRWLIGQGDAYMALPFSVPFPNDQKSMLHVHARCVSGRHHEVGVTLFIETTD